MESIRPNAQRHRPGSRQPQKNEYFGKTGAKQLCKKEFSVKVSLARHRITRGTIMAFTIEKIPLEQIIIITLHPDFDAGTGYPELWKQLAPYVADMEAPIYRITVMEFEDVDLEEMTHMLAQEAQSGMPGSAGDPRVKPLLVSEAALAQMGAASPDQEQYGRINSPVFETLEEALSYAREMLATRY
jgi:hypothetical protein